MVDITVDVTEFETGVDFDVSLSEDEGNNPVTLWVRTKTCPDDRTLATVRDTELTLRCPSGDSVLLYQGSALDVLNQLRDGIRLTPPCTDDQCVDPDDEFTLRFALVDEQNSVPGSSGELSFTLEFHGEQCRHNTDAKNPFPTQPHCPGRLILNRKAISFIAFCAASSEPLDPRIVGVNAVNAEGEMTSLEWETATDVEYVIVKAGTTMTIYDYSDGSARSGIATVRDQTAAIAAYETAPGESAHPCRVAARELGEDFDGTQVTLESDGNNGGEAND